jgi:hypothetical protein
VAARIRRISAEQRRARLARRHHIAPKERAADVATAVEDLVAVHSTDPASVFIGLAQRTRKATTASIEHELYEARSIVRMLGMRRTVHVVGVDLVPVVHASSTRAVSARERKRTLDFVERAGIPEPKRWLEKLEDKTVRALEQRGEATATELARDVPGLSQRLTINEGTKWAGTISVSTRVLSLLAADGRIVRGRPRGSWISSQYRWAPISSWLPAGVKEPPTAEARAQLVERWLRCYGPGTVNDIKWWTGWTLGEVRSALADLAVEEVDVDGSTGVVLAGDVAPVKAPAPFAVLLPALDSTVMGWSDRSWFLGPHGPLLFDGSGNAGPTVWWDDRVVGGWAQRKNGDVVCRVLEDVGTDAGTAIDAAAARLTSWLGATRVTPRFRTPVERELAD